MRTSWISLYGFFALIWTVSGTYRYHSAVRCECNGRSRYCLPDAQGLHCLDCQDNTEGRHCERCKEGYYHQRAGESCSLCRCSPAGSVGPKCDSRGRCVCKGSTTGDKCDRCPNGASVGPNGCGQRTSRQTTDHTEPSTSCFCYGHSNSCSPARDYIINTITSTFTDGPQGWRIATAQGMTPSQVHFRWSPTHQDVEVISKNSLPVYLYAPASYLGDQLLSYGQNLSFSLRLDRGVRHPSTNDVVLEGSDLRVTASLGDLRSIVPCGKKITYTFRLDEQPASKWRPHLSAFQFQTLLQNLTAIKIRGTFGENGRGYLDNVAMVSARRGAGNPATWVQSCSCPKGYEGQFCERCASGFKRRSSSDGPFSPCEPCNCRGGGCDPETGDCYSADETPSSHTCLPGFYSDPGRSLSCVSCPCSSGVSCSLAPDTLEVRCDLCPPGTAGSRCHTCQEGFYGNPKGESGPVTPCRPCQCNGHMDPNAVGNCDSSTGECLKCLNRTRGFNCEECQEGFHHSQPTEDCKPCDCSPQGSVSNQCSDMGQCLCKEGFEGHQCQRSSCPSCFDPIKTKMEGYAHKLLGLEMLFAGMEGGTLPGSDAQMERTLRTAEELLTDMQRNVDRLTEAERDLQARLAAVSRSQLTEGRDIQAISDAAEAIEQLHENYQTQASDIQTLIKEVRRKLEDAKSLIKSAEFPIGDAALDSDTLSSLVQTASDLAEKHTNQADTIERTANEALADSEEGMALMRSIMNKENRVKELIGDLKTKYDDTSAQVKALESQATRLSGEARDESRMADDMLKQLATLEPNIPQALKDEIDTVTARLDGLKEQVDENLSDYQTLQENVQEDKAAVGGLLAQGKAAQQEYEQLLARVNAAKADTQAALNGITDNMDGVDDALAKLRGFDEQISNNKGLAYEAIKRLPAINATIQQAVGSNSKTQLILAGISGDYDDALGTVGQLETVVSRLEGMSGSLPSHAGLPRDSTNLKEELQGLKRHMEAAEKEVVAERVNAEKLRDAAEEASNDATGAYNNSKQTRSAVGETLQTVNDLLSVIGQPGSVDEERLRELETSLADARNKINQKLRLRLHDIDDKEETQRARLASLNLDIDKIMRDISNLEDIRETIPHGCFSTQPKEIA